MNKYIKLIILLIISIILLTLSIIILIKNMIHDSYCSSLSIQEYLEQREYCKDVIEK